MRHTKENARLGRAGAVSTAAGRVDQHPTTRRTTGATAFRVHGDVDLVVTFRGRAAWALLKLLTAGERGVSAFDCPPGLRLASYVHRLRRAGVAIDADQERHGGEFGGCHARYRLACRVTVERGG